MSCNSGPCCTPQAVNTPATEHRPSAIFHPQSDAYLVGDTAVITLDMPGCRADKIDITFDRGVLTVRGQVEPRRPKHLSEDAVLLSEYGEGDYYRTFRIDFPVDSTAIGAQYVGGVLTVRVPQHEAARQRRVPVSERAGN